MGWLSRHERWALPLAVAAGLGLRFYSLGERSLWFDELQQASVASLPWPDFWDALKLQLAPPLDYILLKLLFLTDWRSDLWARFAAASFSTAALLLVYRLGSEAFNRRVGALAATFLAASTFAIQYAQEARMYSFFMFLSAFSAWRLLRFCREPSGANAAALGALNGLALLTQYFAIWSLLSQAILLAALAARGRLGRRGTLWALESLTLSVAIFLPWLPSFLAHLSLTGGGVHYAQSTSWDYVLHLFGRLASGKREALGLVVLFALGWGNALRQGRAGGALLGWLFVVGLGVPLAYALFRPTLTDRNLIFLLPFFLTVVAAGLDLLLERARMPLLAGVLGIFAFASGHLWGFYAEGENAWKVDWRKAAELIQRQGQPQERVLVLRWSARVALDYYLAPPIYPPMPADDRNPPQRRVWVLANDPALLAQLQRGQWRGWLVLEVGTNRPTNLDGIVASFQPRLPAALASFHAPRGHQNGIAVYHLTAKSPKHP